MNGDTKDGMPDEDPPAPSALRSQADFTAALHWALRHALRQRVRRITWLDADFSAWPLDDAGLLESLQAWLRLPQRRLVLIAHSYDAIPRRHPRFVAWRRNWSHAIEAWTPQEGEPLELPTLMVDDSGLCLQVFDRKQWRGRLSQDVHAMYQWVNEIDALMQRCEAAFPVHQLGL
jgi:hypothetical protein